MILGSKKLAIGSQYFIYFGVLGVFLPYFNLYCYRIGFSGWEIGVLSAVRSVVMVIFPLLWGALADRLELRRPIYIFCNIISTVIWAAFLLTTDFKPMLLVMICYAVFHAPIISSLEAFTMDVLGGEKKSYGRIRAWGSISFSADQKQDDPGPDQSGTAPCCNPVRYGCNPWDAGADDSHQGRACQNQENDNMDGHDFDQLTQNQDDSDKAD